MTLTLKEKFLASMKNEVASIEATKAAEIRALDLEFSGYTDGYELSVADTSKFFDQQIEELFWYAVRRGCVAADLGFFPDWLVELIQEDPTCLALCEARHEMPDCVTGSIFGNTVDPLDIEGMKSTVATVLDQVDNLHLYVTGLTVALVEVINYCVLNGVKLTLWHYDRESGWYYPQEVIVS